MKIFTAIFGFLILLTTNANAEGNPYSFKFIEATQSLYRPYYNAFAMQVVHQTKTDDLQPDVPYVVLANYDYVNSHRGDIGIYPNLNLEKPFFKMNTSYSVSDIKYQVVNLSDNDQLHYIAYKEGDFNGDTPKPLDIIQLLCNNGTCSSKNITAGLPTEDLNSMLLTDIVALPDGSLYLAYTSVHSEKQVQLFKYIYSSNSWERITGVVTNVVENSRFILRLLNNTPYLMSFDTNGIYRIVNDHWEKVIITPDPRDYGEGDFTPCMDDHHLCVIGSNHSGITFKLFDLNKTNIMNNLVCQNYGILSNKAGLISITAKGNSAYILSSRLADNEATSIATDFIALGNIEPGSCAVSYAGTASYIPGSRILRPYLALVNPDKGDKYFGYILSGGANPKQNNLNALGLSGIIKNTDN